MLLNGLMERAYDTDIVVIIVNYNTKGLLLQCLMSIFLFTRNVNYEVLVIDNNSSDGSVAMLKKLFPSVKVIGLSRNLGFARANNVGIQATSSKYCLLLNSDTFLIDNSIKHFYDFMERPESISFGCCGGELIGLKGKKQASFGNFPSLLEAFLQIGFYKIFPSFYNRKLSAAVVNIGDECKTVDFVCGADMFLRRSALETVGLFDEDFFLYFEETELAFRFNRHKLLSVVNPSIRIVHLEGGSQERGLFNLKKIEMFCNSRKTYWIKTAGVSHYVVICLIFTLQNLLLSLFKLNRIYLKIAKIVFKT